MTANDLANASRCYCFSGTRYQEAFLYLAALIASGEAPPPSESKIVTEGGDTIVTEGGDTIVPE